MVRRIPYTRPRVYTRLSPTTTQPSPRTPHPAPRTPHRARLVFDWLFFALIAVYFENATPSPDTHNPSPHP